MNPPHSVDTSVTRRNASIGTASHPIVPIVVIDDHRVAADLGHLLRDGGIGAVEVALRTPAGLAAVTAMRSAVPELLVGAGTVTTVEGVRSAADAGARFVVCPGLDPLIVEETLNCSLEPLPGIATPSELQHAVRLGVSTAKVFPVTQLGGPDFLRALAGPFPAVRYFPSGGIGMSAVSDYLAIRQVAAVGCSWVVPRAALQSGDLDLVAAQVGRARSTVEAAGRG